MNKSLGDYNVEKSSSHNIRNIIWTKKNQVDPEKSKNKKTNSDKKFQNSSASNIIYCHKPKLKSNFVKVIKIKIVTNTEKSKNKKTNSDKKFQNSSASYCSIKQGFKRPGR
ncbi:MAG: hypothetical protein OEL84_00385 [Nitrosopumilus sp.]|nr:hypothetical protein [Nitrosopumilus sp.]